MKKNRFFTSGNIAFLAVLVALIIVLQSLGTLIGNLGGTAPSLVLIPIVLGAVMMGPVAGALLGFIFGIVVIVCGVTGFDWFSYLLFTQAPVWTILLCLVKGTAAGFAAGWLYRLIAKKNRYAAVITASLAAPIVNTGIFVAGTFLLQDAMYAVMGEMGFAGEALVYFVFIRLCANFIFEFIINAVASPIIYRVIEIVKRSRRGGAEETDELPETAEAAETPKDVRAEEKAGR